MRLAELIMALVLAAFSAYLMYQSGAPAWPGDPWFENIWYIPGEGPGGGFWPFWLAFIMLLSCGWIVVNWVRRTSPPSRATGPFLDAYGVRMMVLVGGGVTAFIFLSDIISMYGAMALFLLYYLRFLGRHPWRLTIAVAVLMPIGMFFFFDVAMTLPLPKGLRSVEDTVFTPLYDIFL
ncbi:MAG: tripartite tricarboxylate transporter TctB family protein [Pseudomonadota bacterium]